MSERRIATVLMLDIVGSTHVAAELGDARYRELSARFVRIVRGAVKRFGGREEDNAGDGFFVTFDQPDRAISCAGAIADEVRGLGIEIRCGIHTGQVESGTAKAQGIAVVIGARVMSLAGPGEILATSTTTQLVAGSGFGFEDLTAHELKGVPGTWQVFAVTSVAGEPRTPPLPPEEAAKRRSTLRPGVDRRRPRRPALLVGALAAIALIATIVSVAFVAGSQDPSTRTENTGITRPSAAVVEVDPDQDPPIIRSIPVPVERHGVGGVSPPAAAHPIVVGQGGVWTVRFRSLYHVDPLRSEVRTRINLETPISFSFNLAEGADKIWVSFNDGLIEVNPGTDDQRRVFSFDPTEIPFSTEMTFGGGFVWIGVGSGNLIRVDPGTDRDVRRTGLDPIDALAFGYGSLWTLDVVSETMSEYEPESMERVARIPVGGGDRIVVGDSAIWVLSRTQGTLTRIDPSTNETTGVVQVGPTPTVLAAGGGAIWVGDEDGVIREVDEDTRQVTDIPFGAEIRGLAYDDATGTLWVDVL